MIEEIIITGKTFFPNQFDIINGSYLERLDDGDIVLKKGSIVTEEMPYLVVIQITDTVVM